jgi:membrane fusion protein (multidrug efflux system)
MDNENKVTPLRPDGAAAPAATQVIAPPEAEPPRNKRRPYVFVLVIVGAMLLGIAGWLVMTAGEQDTDDAQVMADLVPIGTRVAGQVVKVAIVENQLVKKGDAIAEIDPADYIARVKQAEADFASSVAQAAAADAQVAVISANSKGGFTSARSALMGSTMSVGSAEAQVASARAALLRAQADAKKSELDLNRAKELKSANAIPQQQLDNAEATHEVNLAALQQAKANVAVAEESRRMAQERVGEARGRLDQSSPIQAQVAAAQANADLAHARVQSSQAQLDLARLQLSYTKVTAPADGIASKLSVHEGQQVTIGSPVISLVPVQTYLVANFKETQITKMKPGQRADIRIDAFPGHKLAGKVESISGGTGSSFSLLPADNASGNFVKVVQRVPVRIAFDKTPDLPLRAGLSADVTVHTGD